MNKLIPSLLLAATAAFAKDPAPESAAPAPDSAPVPSEAPAETTEPTLSADCAAIVLQSAGDARWIVAEGPIVRALRDAAAAAGGKAVVLPLVGGDDEMFDAADAAAAGIPSEKVRRALDFGAVPFLRAWLDEDPDAVASQVFLAGSPALADATGRVALPSGLGYRIVAEDAVSNGLAAAAAACTAARDALGEALSTSADPKAAYSPAVGPYRALAGQAGNRLGCLLFRAGQTNEALQAFLAADAVYPPGASAALNAASLVRRGTHPESAAGVARRLESIARGDGRWNLYAEGGPVLFPEDFFEGSWYWTVSGLVPFADGSDERLKTALEAIPEADRPRAAARLRQGARLVGASVAPVRTLPADAPADALVAAADRLFYRGERHRADRLLRKASLPSAADRARITLARARLLATGGNAAKATELLEAALEGSSADPMPDLGVSDRELYLRGLAEVAAETLDLRALRPRLLALVGEKGLFADWAAKDSAAIGSLLLGDASAANEGAAAAVAAATNAAPDRFPASWAPLRVRAFFALQTGAGAAAAEAAEALLEARGGHDFFGHYVLALQARDAGENEKADARFQASLAERAVWFVLNDYAASLAARGATAPALMFARQAVLSGGEDQAAVQDTLGMALLHAGDAGGALEALRRAAALPGGGMPAIRLDLAEALAANGLHDELAEQLKALEPALAVADEEIRERAARLRADLAAEKLPSDEPAPTADPAP